MTRNVQNVQFIILCNLHYILLFTDLYFMYCYYLYSAGHVSV